MLSAWPAGKRPVACAWWAAGGAACCACSTKRIQEAQNSKKVCVEANGPQSAVHDPHGATGHFVPGHAAQMNSQLNRRELLVKPPPTPGLQDEHTELQAR